MTNKNAWERYKDNLGDTRPWDLINPNTEFASESLQKERYSICNSCPEFIGLTKQCRKCGCFMHLKTKIQVAACPLNKW